MDKVRIRVDNKKQSFERSKFTNNLEGRGSIPRSKEKKERKLEIKNKVWLVTQKNDKRRLLRRKPV